MESMSLFRRLLGSVIDKVLILIIFVVAFNIINGESTATYRLGTYYSIGTNSPSSYEFITLNGLLVIDNGWPLKYHKESEDDILLKYKNEDVVGMVRSFDLTITFAFIFINILYYLLSELFLAASVGKWILGGQIRDDLFGERISSSDAFKRAIIGGLLMALAVGLRFLLDINYIIVIFAYFLILDIFVFFNRKSLIDIISKVTYVERLSSVVKKHKESNEIMVLEKNKAESPIIVEKEQEEILIQETDIPKTNIFHFPSISQMRISKNSNNVSIKMASVYIYVIWLAINITALSYAMANPHMSRGGGFSRSPFDELKINTRAFYPFESNDIGTYDLSEFVVYTVAIPLCLFAIIKLILLFVPSKTNK